LSNAGLPERHAPDAPIPEPARYAASRRRARRAARTNSMPGNNWVENQIRPWAIGRANWLFAGSLRAGQRAAAIMSLIRQLNGHDPHAYLKDILTRLPTHKASDISALLPHRWQPTVTVD